MKSVGFIFEDVETYLPVLRSRLPGVDIFPCSGHEKVASLLNEHQPEIVLVGKFSRGSFPRDALLASASVKWIHAMSTGLDHIAPWDPAKIKVTSSRGLYSEAIAQYVLWAMLSFNFQLHHFQELARKRAWSPALVETLQGKRLIILGAGNIGSKIAEAARPFGVQIVGLRSRIEVDPLYDAIVDWSSLDLILPNSNYIVNCLPLSAATKGKLDRSFFMHVMPGACFIDVARGGVTQISALVEALQSGHVAAAFLDVCEQEPLPANHILWDLKNVSITCHSSGNTRDWPMKAINYFCDLYAERIADANGSSPYRL